MFDFPLLPEASATAARTDILFLGLTIASAFVILLVFGLVIGFSVRYRKGAHRDRPSLPQSLRRSVENSWTLATGFAFFGIFMWAASQDFDFIAPAQHDPLQVRVVAKQWMWKIQHPGGQREIDALHVPVDQPIRLLMDSQDVIHSFYVPAFRIKQDVVPGLTRTLSFTPTKTGVFPLVCAEYCGTRHSEMAGKIYVMTREKYAAWLETADKGDDLAEQGRQLFVQLGCSGCHGPSSAVHAPSLTNVYKSAVPLSDGNVIVADDRYIYDSIIQPKSQVVAGFQPIMPSFAGRVSQAQLVALVAYIKSLGNKGEGPDG